MKTGTQMVSYNSPPPEEETPGGALAGFKTPLGFTQQRSSKIQELQ